VKFARYKNSRKFEKFPTDKVLKINIKEKSMSVVIETSIGDLVIDLYCDERPSCRY